MISTSNDSQVDINEPMYITTRCADLCTPHTCHWCHRPSKCQCIVCNNMSCNLHGFDRPTSSMCYDCHNNQEPISDSLEFSASIDEEHSVFGDSLDKHLYSNHSAAPTNDQALLSGVFVFDKVYGAMSAADLYETFDCSWKSALWAPSRSRSRSRANWQRPAHGDHSARVEACQ